MFQKWPTHVAAPLLAAALLLAAQLLHAPTVRALCGRAVLLDGAFPEVPAPSGSKSSTPLPGLFLVPKSE